MINIQGNKKLANILIKRDGKTLECVTEDVFKAEVDNIYEEINNSLKTKSGLDFYKIGYSQEMTDVANNILNKDIEYSMEIAQNWDAYNTNGDEYFKGDKNLKYFPAINTANLLTANYFLADCPELRIVPELDFGDTHDATNLFDNCTKLEVVGGLRFERLVDGDYMFGGCTNLKTIHSLISPILEDAESMFRNCTNLQSLPLLDFATVDSISYFFGFSDILGLTDLGGFKDLKIDWNDTYGLCRCPNLTKQSILNVITNLYDFRTNGDTETTRTLKLHSNSLSLLSDDDKAIATDKGWILIS